MNNIFLTSTFKAIRLMVVAVIVLSFVDFSLASCSDDDNAPRPGDGQKIAAILKAEDAYWQHVAKGVTEAAKEVGLGVDIYYSTADVDPTTQLKNLNALDLTQYKGIIIAPSAPDQMLVDIKKVAAQLPVVVIDSPINENVGYHAFIGMDNKAAGAHLFESVIASETSINATALILQLEGNPAIAERVEGLKAASTAFFKKIEVITVPDDAAQIATKVGEAITSMGSEPYFLFAANGTVANGLLSVIDQYNPAAFISAFDVTEPILKAIVERNAVTMAQDNYGYGYEGVKAILVPATGKPMMIAPRFITPTNVNNPDVIRYLNGYEVPKAVNPGFDVSKLTGTFISTSVDGIPYPEEDVITFTFNAHNQLIVGMNYGFFTQNPEWYELPVNYRIAGDKIIGVGYGFSMEATVTTLTDDKMNFDAIFKIYGASMSANCTTQKSIVDYSQSILGTWIDNSSPTIGKLFITYSENGNYLIEQERVNGGKTELAKGSYYLRGNHVGINSRMGTSEDNRYLSLRISIDGDNMTEKGYMVSEGAVIPMNQTPVKQTNSK